MTDDRAARRELKARQAELRERLAQEQALLRARVAQEQTALRARIAEQRANRAGLPDTEAERRRRRRRRIAMLILLALLLWALLRGCDCDEPPPPTGSGPAPAPVGVWLVDAAPPPPPPPPRRRARRRPKLKPKPRPAYEPVPPAPPSWLTGYRLQVASRAPRLSRCFEGAERPGALKWTASVDLARGVVSDHRFEPVLAGVTLSKPLRSCLVATLSRPPYRLLRDSDQPSPSRVSIVIEF